MKSFRHKPARLIQLTAQGHLPRLLGAAVGTGRVLVRRMHCNVKSQCWSNASAWGFGGTEVCKPQIHILLSMYAYREGKPFSWQGNGDKCCNTPFIWGFISAEPAAITNFLSQLIQHFCQRNPGHAVCSRVDLLFCADLNSCFRLWLKSYGIYNWVFPDS